jgi:hypothetical protein
MNISGIRMSPGFYEYNLKKSRELQAPQTVEPERASAETENTPDMVMVETEKFSEPYQPDVLYERKESDSDRNDLDVEQFMSGLEMDQVLQQYQFFVGEPLMGTGTMENRMSDSFSL